MSTHDRGTEGEDRRRDHSFERTRDDHTQMEGGVRSFSEPARRGHGRIPLRDKRLRVREAQVPRSGTDQEAGGRIHRTGQGVRFPGHIQVRP